MEDEKVVFESKTSYGYNIIIEKDDCYVLRAPKGEAIFDKKKMALRAVIKAIKDYGNAAYSTRKGCGFRFQNHKSKQNCTLGQVLYCAYNKLSLSDLAHGNLRYLDGHPYNLRKENLAFPQRQTIKYISVLGKRYILIKIETADHKCHYAITNDDPTLFSLLSDMGWQYQKTERSFKANFGTSSYTLHQIIWTYFNYSNVTKENLAEKAANVRAKIKADNLSIDHKKSSLIRKCWDNRIENLRLIPNNLNLTKRECTSKFHGDLFYIPTTSGEMYGRYNWTDGYIDLCENLGDPTIASIDQLRRFSKSGEFETTDSYCQIQLDSPKAAEIQLADLQETKLYSEVLIYEH